jgi:hypothetical protein
MNVKLTARAVMDTGLILPLLGKGAFAPPDVFCAVAEVSGELIFDI